MKKIYIIQFLFVVAGGLKLNAQCSIGVAPLVSGCTAVTYAIATTQTFQPTCSGVLKEVVVPNISAYSDDLRSTGFSVQCRLKSSTGTLLASSAQTDQWYPGATVTFDFSCVNLNLVTGTTYQLEFFSFNPPYPNYPLVLFCHSASSVYAGGNYIADDVANTNMDLYGWTVNLADGSIAGANSSKTQTITPCAGFYNAVPQLIASVQPGATNGIAGSTTAKVWLESTQPAQFVKRHYEITPASNAATATGRITLYYTQAEFDAFNAVNTVKLPTGTADASGKANLLIEKRPGTSSNGTGLPATYTGTATTINPADADIVWNSGASRWEVTFDVTGFSGFFVKTVSGILPLQWLQVNSTLNGNKQAVINWQVQEQNVASYIIEQSADGRLFTVLASINSKGDGTNSYTYTGATALQGTAYYRIKQVDKDGRISYSSIMRLNASENGFVSVYPTLCHSGFTITSAKPQKVMLLTTTGQTQQTIIVNTGSSYVDVSNLVNGMYILKFADGNTQKIIKQ